MPLSEISSRLKDEEVYVTSFAEKEVFRDNPKYEKLQIKSADDLHITYLIDDPGHRLFHELGVEKLKLFFETFVVLLQINMGMFHF